ncbi:Multi-sensor signal transduction histidine kinase [Candidatus Zixiibacteriota bacterium]|nr:Multi-sensor signal transduction histidine kinase [candidate division Zixibacteria bacterium]
MKLRNKFLYFVIALHLILTVLAYFLLAYNKFLFFGMQLLVLISAAVSYRLYRNFVRPLEILAAGVDSIRDRDFSCTVTKTGNDELDHLIEVYNRMIEQLRLERLSQQEQNYFLERLINAASIGVVVLDLDKKVSLINPAAEKILGASLPLTAGRPLIDKGGEPFNCLAEMEPGESRIIRFGGIRVYRCHKSQFLDRGFHRQFLLLEELTAEIIGTQRTAYEKVIRAMSHEVNNSVGAINSILNSVLDYEFQLNENDRTDYHEAVSVAIERNRRLGKFVENFADVVRIPPPNKVKYDVHKLLKSIHSLMNENSSARNIEWRLELSPHTLDVEIDVSQMEQALINIFKNATEAIDRNGFIIIRTCPNPKMLSIIDSGRGFDPYISSNLFVPFFTTKKNGQGIGLTLIREILMNHGFAFSLKKNDDDKTEFQIVFGN